MFNRVILIGRLGADPEFKEVGSNQVTKFSLATTEKSKDAQGEIVEKTEWHRVVVWARQAEIARDYLKKGSLINLEGKVQYGSYDSKEGHKVYTTDIVGYRFTMLEGKKDKGSDASATQTGASKGGEDLPF